MRPDYAWAALNSRMEGLEKTTRKAHPQLRIDFMTYIQRVSKGSQDILVLLGSQKIAIITPEKVSVQYTYKSATLHRMMNEIVMTVGWAVADREGTWLLIRRKHDNGVVHPFLPRTLATVTREGDSPIFEPSKG